MTELRFIGDWQLWGGLLAGLVLAVAAWVLYWREARSRRGVARWALPTLRALAVWLLVLMLTGPVLHHRKTIGEIARILVLVDASESMNLNDAELEAPRKLLIAQQLGWLATNKFNADLRGAMVALDQAQAGARKVQPTMPAPQFHELVRGFSAALEEAGQSLARVGSEAWPAQEARRAQFNLEVAMLARQLAEATVGRDPQLTARELQTLAKAAARWSAELRAALLQHIAAVAARGESEVTAALAKFDSQTRWRRMETALLGGAESVAAQLAGQHRLELAALAGGKVEPVWLPGAHTRGPPPPAPSLFPFNATNRTTDLSEPLRARVPPGAEAERLAVLLLTDGQHNASGSPVEVARQLGTRGVPVFPVAIGLAQRPRDLAVLGVTGPETVLADGRVRGEVTLKDDVPPGQPFQLRIEHEGQVLWAQELRTEQQGRRMVEFDFPVRPAVAAELKRTDSGLKRHSLPLHLKVTATPVPGEKSADNNRGELAVNVVTHRPRVLLLEGRPRWEFRYLRNLFERDDRWEVNALVAGVGGEQRPWTRGKEPGRFPADKETLFDYQLIIFGDLPPGQLRAAELEWIRDFVGQRGGGVIFIDGRQERLASWQTTALAPLFPVSFEGRPLDGVTVNLQLKASGSSLTPLTLASDALENARLWWFLSPPRWLAPARALPGAETWLEAVALESRSAAAVFRRYGAGKTLYLAFDESWRWRHKVGDLYHQRFWNQTAKWMMDAPFAVEDRFVSLDVGALVYAPGDPVAIRARLRDAAGRLLIAGRAEAVFLREGRRAASVVLSPDENQGGTFRAQTTLAEEGDYQVRVKVEGIPESELKAQVSFSVRAPGGGELAQLHCDEELLRQIAAHSGGEFFREEELGALVQRLKPMSEGRVVESETVLWQSWWWFAAVLLLLALEWAWRKRAGMM